jgi:quaternary ammonium compound-resistance protein SugE
VSAGLAWAILLAGGCFEVGFTTCLRFVDGFRNVPWTVGFLVSVALSMALLELAARTIPMGTAYAVWTGIGALGTAVLGVWWLGEAITPLKAASLALITVGLVGLKVG